MSDLEDFLSNQAITIESFYLGADKPNGFEVDRWNCRISFDNKSEVFEFFSGIGNRKVPAQDERRIREKLRHYSDSEVKRHLAAAVKPTEPNLADVIYCLMGDVNSGNMSFGDYCSEFGGNTDSRKDLDTYLKVQENGNKIEKLLGYKLIESMSGLEH